MAKRFTMTLSMLLVTMLAFLPVVASQVSVNSITWDDANGDEAIDGIDVQLLRLFIAGHPVEINEVATSVNRDGRITPADAHLLMQNIQYSSMEINPTITVDTVTVQKYGNISVPITISNNTGILGAMLTVHYDSNLTLTNIERDTALSSLSMTPPGSFLANPINIAWDGEVAADVSNGTIAILTFSVPNQPRTYEISISYRLGDIFCGDLMPITVNVVNGGIVLEDVDEVATLQEKLNVLIQRAEGLLCETWTSEDGRNVPTNRYWTTLTDREKLIAAVIVARSVLEEGR